MYSRRSHFTSESIVHSDDPSLAPSENSDTFLLDPVSSSYERHHRSRYPQRSYPQATKKKQKAPAKKQRYAPVGIPKGKMGAGLLLEHEEVTSHDDEDDLDQWLESAMASQSVDKSTSMGESVHDHQLEHSGDEADLDRWLDSVIRR